jgi:hypothetical protein
VTKKQRKGIDKKSYSLYAVCKAELIYLVGGGCGFQVWIFQTPLSFTGTFLVC